MVPALSIASASTSLTGALKVSTALTSPFWFTPKIRAVSPESFDVHQMPSYFRLLISPDDSLTRESWMVKSFFAVGVGVGVLADPVIPAAPAGAGITTPARLSRVTAVTLRAFRSKFKTAPRGQGRGQGSPAAAGPASRGSTHRTRPGCPDSPERRSGRPGAAGCGACAHCPRTAPPLPGSRPVATPPPATN